MPGDRFVVKLESGAKFSKTIIQPSFSVLNNLFVLSSVEAVLMQSCVYTGTVALMDNIVSCFHVKKVFLDLTLISWERKGISILAFSVIESFTIHSAATAVTLFQVYTNRFCSI